MEAKLYFQMTELFSINKVSLFFQLNDVFVLDSFISSKFVLPNEVCPVKTFCGVKLTLNILC